MSRRLVSPSLARASGVAGVVVALAAGLGALPGMDRAARANGRLPGTVSINFRQGHDSDIVAGLTFGLAISHDSGATWHWMCDDAIGIAGGPYDPIYAFSPTGTLFATTLGGLVAMRDSCAFGPSPAGKTFVSATTLGPDGAFYYAAAQTAAPGIPADFQIYRSTDDGLMFPVHPQPDPDPATDNNVWWESIAVAPGNTSLVYLTGFRIIPASPGSTDTVRDHLLVRSEDGGATWAPSMPPTLTGLTLSQNSLIHIVGIASDDPRHVYARVSYIDKMISDGLYVSTDAGVSWTLMHSQPDRFIAFVVRTPLHDGHHDLLTATAKFGTEISHDDGMTWGPLAGAPHINCLAENSAGELWACTQNYGVGQAQSDDAGIMKTTDLSAWTKVLRYQDLAGPVTGCGADTVEQKTCNQATLWCGVCAQLGCTPAASYVCPVTASEVPVNPPMTRGGCCDAGARPGGPLALALSVATLLWRPRRRRRSR